MADEAARHLDDQGVGNWKDAPSGLRVRDDAIGQGDPARTGQLVSVHYTGWLDDGGEPGRKFDSSRDRGAPFSFTLGVREVISGWDLGVEGMRVGGRRTLVIPADLGYGDRGAGRVIPPGAVLRFEVELLGLS